jgi:hypothetical protein
MTLKVLELEFWQRYPELYGDDLKPIEPVYNRNGYYYDTISNKCWFESDGDAFEMNKDQFIFELKIKNHKPLIHKEREAIKILISSKLASKNLKEILYMDNLILECRENTLDMLKTRRRFITKIKEKKHGK